MAIICIKMQQFEQFQIAQLYFTHVIVRRRIQSLGYGFLGRTVVTVYSPTTPAMWKNKNTIDYFFIFGSIHSLWLILNRLIKCRHSTMKSIPYFIASYPADVANALLVQNHVHPDPLADAERSRAEHCHQWNWSWCASANVRDEKTDYRWPWPHCRQMICRSAMNKQSSLVIIQSNYRNSLNIITTKKNITTLMHKTNINFSRRS